MIDHPWIDGHVHLWNPARGDDILVLKHEPQLRGGATGEALALHLKRTNALGAIVVQSAPSIGHSDWLFEECCKLEGIIGIVGWVDVPAPEAAVQIRALHRKANACGARVMFNRMENPRAVLSAPAIAAFSLLADLDLTAEILAPPETLNIVADLAARVPDLRIVIDHCGQPGARGLDDPAWLSAMHRLSGCRRVYVKFSGLIEPFGGKATTETILPVANVVVQSFGPARLLLASNFPCMDLGGGPAKWQEIFSDLTGRLDFSEGDRTSLCTGTVFRAYPRLGTVAPHHRAQ